jgi:hypothetical protein
MKNEKMEKEMLLGPQQVLGMGTQTSKIWPSLENK